MSKKIKKEAKKKNTKKTQQAPNLVWLTTMAVDSLTPSNDNFFLSQ